MIFIRELYMKNSTVLSTALLGLSALISLTGCINGHKTSVSKELTAEDTTASRWPRIERRKPDPAIEKRVQELLATMDLDRKIGQMIQIEIRSFTPADMKKYRFGAVLNGGGSWPHDNKHAGAAEWVALSDSIWQSCAEGLEHPIPPLWGTDAVHGHNNFVGATIFPHNIGLGASHDTSLVFRIGQATAKEVFATGINWNFAPTVAVVHDKRWGRTYESYSELPEMVAANARNYIAGLQGTFGDGSVLATAKHYIGDGGTVYGDDRGDNIASEEQLISIHAAGYIAALKAGAQVVMASYSSWQGTRMHANRYLLTDVLKNRLGFDGFVVSDWDGIETVAGCSKNSCPNAVNAGIDMFMVPLKMDWQPFFDNLKKQVETGDVPMSRIDDAVSRILRVKLRMGLIDQKKPGERVARGSIPQPGNPQHRALAREAVRKSLVLLKNNNALLPLDRNARILVTGRGADSIALQAGGWSVTWQGNDNTNRDFENATSILKGIKAAGSKVRFDPVCDTIKKELYDVAIVVIGEKPYAEYKGDIEGGLTLEHANNYPGDIELLRKIKNAHIPVVTIFLSGRPLCVNRELNCSDAFVASWLPGSEGAGIADVLFKAADGTRAYDFTGKLSFAWPKRPCPSMNVSGIKNNDHLFPAGYGLNYAGANTTIDSIPEYINDGYGCNEGTNLVSGLIDSVKMVYNGAFSSAEGAWMGGPDNWSGQAGGPDAQIRTLNVSKASDKNGDSSKALHFMFTGSAYWGIGGEGKDLSGYFTAGYSLAFDVFVKSKPEGAVSIAITCNYPCQDEVDITGILCNLPVGKWERIRIPLKKYMAANFMKINSPFQVFSTGIADVMIADIRWEK
jgi:beta-glucosidase